MERRWVFNEDVQAYDRRRPRYCPRPLADLVDFFCNLVFLVVLRPLF